MVGLGAMGLVEVVREVGPAADDDAGSEGGWTVVRSVPLGNATHSYSGFASKPGSASTSFTF